ncbi:hypothetical protein G1K53_12200 [Tenacibaculum finnmarkense]|uniref:hypothetical protein n=2 Tax=Tenacibaculum finnmarkense TaxID=2781243 RepID=UPI001EFBAE9B|nr:hypothetical protein [Tenacibaculum finnmarkense]MCG8208352.1 hypothetical protein [Tenacibaculum finnmarkense genomovar finnmarkense]MCG8742590.1 hypothetical protein [Tenacibaculum finnmarkense]MCG8766079.1 hypothetical protein [Tenacibaculum finnmarkense]
MDLMRNRGLNGVCASKAIAERLEGKTRDTLSNKSEFDRKYSKLKNGRQASQWAARKATIRKLEDIIERETQKLTNEKSIAISLGLNGWFSKIGRGLCKKNVRRRERAENSLQDAEKALGEIKGSYELLGRQQTEGLRKASEVIVVNKKTIADLETQIQAVKTKIANYKIERDNIKKAEIAATKTAQTASNMVSINSAKKMNTAGFGSFLSKENLPLIIGGALLVGGVFYFKNKNSQVKKVVA